MKKLWDWFYEPKEMQFREGDLTDFQSALQNHEVQARWFDAMISRIREINIEIDKLLAKEDRQRVWETFAIERRTLLAVLRMILDARDTLNSERFEQDAQNRLFERYRGAAAKIGQ